MRDERRRAFPALMASVAALLFLLAACSSDSGSSDGGSDSSDSGSAPTQSDLDGSTFTATTGTGLVKDSTTTLSFENGTMAVDGGCNSQSAQYEVDRGTLRWTSRPASTLKACPPELEAQDAVLTSAFTSGVGATLDGKTLTLTSGDSAHEMTLVLEQG